MYIEENDVYFTKRNGTIDFLKFIFAVIIMMHHSYQFYPLLTEGFIGVEFFFMVTGWLLAKKIATIPPHLVENIWDFNMKFVIRKIKAFYLEFFVATLTALFILRICLFHPPEDLFKIFLFTGDDLLLLQIFGFPVYSTTGVVWFLSAMISALFILVPIILKFRNCFLKFIAPLLIIVLFGYMSYKYGHMNAIMKPVFGGFLHIGLLRAIADITAGYCLYFVSVKIKALNLTNIGVCFITLIEISCYTISLYLIVTTEEYGYVDFTIVALMAMGISISFSERSLLFKFLQNDISFILGAFSLNLFLNHFYIARIISVLGGDTDILVKFVYYILGAVLCSVLNFILAKLIRKLDFNPAKIFIKND